MRKSSQVPAVRQAPPVPAPEEVQVRGRRRAPIEGLAELYDGLMAAGPVRQGPVTLTPVMVKTHPAHPNQIVPDAGPGIATLAYAITHGGRAHGHVLVHAQRKYVLIAPSLQAFPSTHLNLMAAALRAEVGVVDVGTRKVERRSA